MTIISGYRDFSSGTSKPVLPTGSDGGLKDILPDASPLSKEEIIENEYFAFTQKIKNQPASKRIIPKKNSSKEV